MVLESTRNSSLVGNHIVGVSTGLPAVLVQGSTGSAASRTRITDNHFRLIDVDESAGAAIEFAAKWPNGKSLSVPLLEKRGARRATVFHPSQRREAEIFLQRKLNLQHLAQMQRYCGIEP